MIASIEKLQQIVESMRLAQQIYERSHQNTQGSAVEPPANSGPRPSLSGHKLASGAPDPRYALSGRKHAPGVARQVPSLSAPKNASGPGLDLNSIIEQTAVYKQCMQHKRLMETEPLHVSTRLVMSS